MYRIEIDRSLCSGFGSCAELAPGSIRTGADGLAEANHTEVDDPALLDAAASCVLPVNQPHGVAHVRRRFAVDRRAP